VRNVILRAAVVSIFILAGSGCQPKNGDTTSGAPPTSLQPLRRVEVISKSSAELARSVVGRKCRVQIRRDALGMAGNAPAAMSGRWATESSIDGTIIEMSDEWLVVQSIGKRIVVPHASILVVELQD
jgi:hypothetical protein